MDTVQYTLQSPELLYLEHKPAVEDASVQPKNFTDP